MTMTFSEAEKTLLKSIRKVKAESDLNKKILAVEELSAQARNLGAHIARYANISWILHLTFLFFAALVFHAVAWFESVKDILPPELCHIIEPIHNSSSMYTNSTAPMLTNEARKWLWCILGLVVFPVVFDLVFSAVCEHTPVTVDKTSDGIKARTPSKKGDVWNDVWDRVDYVKQMLDNVCNELNPASHLPARISRIFCVLYIVPMAAAFFFHITKADPLPTVDLVGVIFVSILIFLLFLIPFLLVLRLKKRVLALFFSSWKSRRQAEKLRDEFSGQLSGYRSKCISEAQERQRLADLKLGAELYRKATMGGTIDEDLLAQAAEKGDPKANRYIGRRILKRVDDDELSYREIKAICEQAKEYLKRTDTYTDPDDILLYAFVQIYTEGNSESGWRAILHRVQGIDKTKLSRECLDRYDYVVGMLDVQADIARSAVTPSISDVARRLEGGGSGSGFGSEWSSMNDDLDAARRAASITKEYGPGWRGYDAEAPVQDTEALGPDPESFPDSNDIW